MKRLVAWLLLLGACSSNGDATDATVAADRGFAADAVVPVDLGVAEDAGFLDANEPFDLGFADADPIDSGELDADPIDLGPEDTGTPEDAGAAPFTLTSPALMNNGGIPARHTCRGVDLQPELAWTGVPAGTQSFALVLIDDTIDFVHWIAYNMPPSTTSLPEGASDMGMLPAGTIEADAYCVQYCGPCPPSRHTYTFRIYALSVATTSFNWPNTIRARHLSMAFDANSLGVATLSGNYPP